MTNRFAIGAVVLLAFACGGKKDDKAGPAGSAAPVGSAAPAGSAAPVEVADAPLAGSAAADAGSAPGSGSGSAAGSAAPTAAVDLCTVVKREKLEDVMGPWVGPAEGDENPKKLPPGAEGITGCHIDLVNREVTVEAKPVAQFDESPKKYKKAVKDLGEKAFEDEDDGMTVKLAGKPYFLAIKSSAGRSMDNKMALRMAKIYVEALK